jgi:hypothetical protein
MHVLNVPRRGVLVATALLAAPLPLLAQAATITGHVTAAETGGPLPGVTVSIVGMGLGTVTRDNGVYSFTVPASRVSGQTVTLNARRVGYAPLNAPITLAAGTVTHDFVMTAAAQQLEQVIVTGAGTSQVRERVGSVINTVDSTTIKRATQPQNILSAIHDHVDADVRQRHQDRPAAGGLRARERRKAGRLQHAGLLGVELVVGSAPSRRNTSVQSRERDLRRRSHERQRDQRLGREPAHVVLPLRRTHGSVGNDEGEQQSV